jgi:hypothetical protein
MSNIFEDWGFAGGRAPKQSNEGGFVVMLLVGVALLAIYGFIKLIGG